MEHIISRCLFAVQIWVCFPTFSSFDLFNVVPVARWFDDWINSGSVRSI